MTTAAGRRAPRDVREALLARATEQLTRLHRGEVGEVHLPISPELEQAMVSAIAQGHVRTETTSWRRVYQNDMELVKALLAHQYLSKEALRWVTLNISYFWRSGTAQQLAAHPACTVVEAVVASQHGWYDPELSTALEGRWGTGESWEGWRNAVHMWGISGAQDTKAFYRFADEVETGPRRAREVFERLAADHDDGRAGERRKVWELYRLAQHV